MRGFGLPVGAAHPEIFRDDTEVTAEKYRAYFREVAERGRPTLLRLMRRANRGHSVKLEHMTEIGPIEYDVAGLDITQRVDFWPKWWTTQRDACDLLGDMTLMSNVQGTGAVPCSGVELDGLRTMSVEIAWILSQATRLSARPNVFVLSEPLARRLAMTELRGIRTGDVQVPFPGFYVQIPRGLFHSYHHATGMHPVEVFAVAEGEINREMSSLMDIDQAELRDYLGRRLMIYAACGPGERSEDPLDDVLRSLSLPLQLDMELGEILDYEVRELAPLARKSRDPAVVERHRMYEEGLIRLGAPVGNVKGQRPRGMVLGEEIDPSQVDRSMLRFVVNTILYLASPGGQRRRMGSIKRERLEHDLRLATKRRTRVKIERKLDELGAADRWIVGEDERPMTMPCGGWKLLYKTTVRGHWRHQACGPRLSRHRLIWIRPHTRGPGDRAIAHDYEVD